MKKASIELSKIWKVSILYPLLQIFHVEWSCEKPVRKEIRKLFTFIFWLRFFFNSLGQELTYQGPPVLWEILGK